MKFVWQTTELPLSARKRHQVPDLLCGQRRSGRSRIRSGSKDYIDVEVTEFPKGHAAIATSWSDPTTEFGLHKRYSGGRRGPVLVQLDLEEEISSPPVSGHRLRQLKETLAVKADLEHFGRPVSGFTAAFDPECDLFPSTQTNPNIDTRSGEMKEILDEWNKNMEDMGTLAKMMTDYD